VWVKKTKVLVKKIIVYIMDFESSWCLAVKCQNRFAVSPDLNFEIIHKLKPLFFYVFGEKLKCMGIYYKI
jgi:hypothetical protein